MSTVAGILLLVIGVFFPMMLLVWLSMRMQRQPALQPRQVGKWLALNFMLPVGLILLGLGLVSPKLGASLFVRYATWAALGATVVLLIALVVDAVRVQRLRRSPSHGGDNGQ